MAFDRSKYQGKGVSLSKINEGVSEAEKNSKSNFSGGNYEKTVYHTLADGANWFKIAPAHDPNDSPYVPMAVSKLYCEVDVYKDGEPTGDKEVKQKNVFIATVHSPKDSKGRLMVSKDPVELYLDYLFKKANDEIQDKDERKDYLKHVTGFWGKDGKWVGGIKPDHKLATWAWDKQGQIGRFDISKPWFKDMEKLSLNETAEEAIQTDIFTDLVEGYPVIITKERTGEGKAKKTKYTVDADRPKKRESFDEFCERIAISDKSLEEWEAKKSLKELFVGVYSQKDFDLAIDGLERFDTKNKYGIFENQDFLDEIEEIQVMLDKLPKKEEKESKPEDKKESKPTKKETKSSKKEEKEDEEVSPIKMKKFLREYIETNYDEETELPSLTPKELKKWYELALKEEELPFDASEEKEDEKEESEESEADEVPEEELEKQLSNLRKNRGR